MAKDLSARAWGQKLIPPISRQRVVLLCQEGRVQGAYRMKELGKTGPWRIPEDAPDPRKLIRKRNFSGE